LGYSNYTIIRKEDGAKLGCSGLYNREGLEGIDIGFALLEKYEQKGYAFEATHKIKEAAFEDFGITHLKAITTKENFASQNLLKKLGMTFTKNVLIPNDTEELMLFELMN